MKRRAQLHLWNEHARWRSRSTRTLSDFIYSIIQALYLKSSQCPTAHSQQVYENTKGVEITRESKFADYREGAPGKSYVQAAKFPFTLRPHSGENMCVFSHGVVHNSRWCFFLSNKNEDLIFRVDCSYVCSTCLRDAWIFRRSPYEVRTHPLDRCWTHVAQSCTPWAASVTSRDTSKGSSLDPSSWGSSIGRQRSLRPLQIHAVGGPANIQCKILKASHTQAGPHSPATAK